MSNNNQPMSIRLAFREEGKWWNAYLAPMGSMVGAKRRATNELARALAQPPDIVANGLDRLLQRHATEWSAFTNDLGSGSFVRKWIDTAS